MKVTWASSAESASTIRGCSFFPILGAESRHGTEVKFPAVKVKWIGKHTGELVQYAAALFEEGTLSTTGSVATIISSVSLARSYDRTHHLKARIVVLGPFLALSHHLNSSSAASESR